MFIAFSTPFQALPLSELLVEFKELWHTEEAVLGCILTVQLSLPTGTSKSAFTNVNDFLKGFTLNLNHLAGKV